jgi:hypothetical protein
VRRHGAQRERELRESLASTEARRAELADKLHEVETRHRDAMELQAELKLQMMSEVRARQRAELAAAARAGLASRIPPTSFGVWVLPTFARVVAATRPDGSRLREPCPSGATGDAAKAIAAVTKERRHATGGSSAPLGACGSFKNHHWQ